MIITPEELINAVTSVFDTMVFIPIQGEHIDRELLSFSEQNLLISTLGFSGDMSGAISIHSTQNFGRKVAMAMLMMDETSVSQDDIADAMGEISNMVCGNLKMIFSEKGHTINLAIPQTVFGETITKHAAILENTMNNHIVIKLNSDPDYFFVKVLWKN